MGEPDEPPYEEEELAEPDHISVWVRVRPLSAAEADNRINWKLADARTIQQVSPQTGVVLPGSGNTFKFDEVFNNDIGNEEVYEVAARDVVLRVLEGYNGTVLAYGQTSSGKTHTMIGTGDEPGVIPRAVSDIFANSTNIPGWSFKMRVSYMELYNEDFFDLLMPGNKLELREDPDKGVFVTGLNEEEVESAQDVLDLMARGQRNRRVGETNMNKCSSRSHAIFRMIIRSSEIDETGAPEGSELESVLTLVDLAGSERASKSGGDTARLKEGVSINKSLSVLGYVIMKLSEGVEQSGGHIPYRDSKLTRILQPSLGGNAFTAVICAVTPSEAQAEETKSTLQFAARAKQVQVDAKVNELLSPRERERRTNAEALERTSVDLSAMRKQLAESHAAFAQTSAELDEERVAIQSQLAQAQGSQGRVEAELQEVTCQLQEMTRARRLAEEQMATLQQRLAHSEQMQEGLESQIQISQQEKDVLERLVHESEELKGPLQSQLDQSEQERASLQGQLRLSTVETLSLKAELRRSQVAALEAASVQSEAKVDSAGAALEALKSLQDSLRQLEDHNRQLEDDNANLKGERFAMEEGHGPLRQQLLESEEQRRLLQAQLSQAGGERTALQTQLSDAEDERVALLTQLRQLDEGRWTLKNELRQSEEKLRLSQDEKLSQQATSNLPTPPLAE